MEKLKGNTVSVVPGTTNSIIPSEANPDDQSYGLLAAELGRIQSLIGVDKENSRKYSQLSDKISKEETVIEGIKSEIVISEPLHKSDKR